MTIEKRHKKECVFAGKQNQNDANTCECEFVDLPKWILEYCNCSFFDVWGGEEADVLHHFHKTNILFIVTDSRWAGP